MTVFIELYGRLREAGVESPVELELPDGATAADALRHLKTKLGAKSSLLDGAAIAGEDAVLNAESALPKQGRIAALPPVCGG